MNDSLSRPGSASSNQSLTHDQLSPQNDSSSMVTRVDLGSRSSSIDAHHGTPRSVKYRNKVNKSVFTSEYEINFGNFRIIIIVLVIRS